MGQHDPSSQAEERQATSCEHERTVTTVIAGLERVVCDDCGHVSIRYVEPTVRIWSQAPVPSYNEGESNIVIDLTAQPRVAKQSCGSCGSSASYYTPVGLACERHAWEAASSQQSLGVEFGIPGRSER